MSLRYIGVIQMGVSKMCLSSRDKLGEINTFGTITMRTETLGMNVIVNRGTWVQEQQADVQALGRRARGTVTMRMRRSHQRWKENKERVDARS